MSTRLVRLVTALATLVAALALAPMAAAGQAQPANRTNIPRTADGRPDFSGYWQPNGIDSHSLEEGCCDPASLRMGNGGGPRGREGFKSAVVDPPNGRIPYLPAAQAKRNELLYAVETPVKKTDIEPEDICYPLGVPRSNYRGAINIRQTPGAMMFLYEWTHGFRFVPLDGRPHLGTNVTLWNGDARARWEGDTLVIDVTNLREGPWLDSHGSHYTSAMHVVERLTYVDPNTIRYEATIEDPNVFSRPWKIQHQFRRNPDPNAALLEEACAEGISYQLRLDIGRAAVARGERKMHTHEE